MMRKRSTATLLALAALQASLAQALGLGEITLRSALDQPLQAEIRLRGIGDLSADQILVGLAKQSDFDRAGVERLFSLTEMRFAVDIDARGEGVLRVTTERPVREPYLDFVVEVRWPSGRVLREYTVLLDLPTYSPAPVPEVSAPRTRSSGASAEGRSQWTGSGDSYTVQRNDTLWSIASRTRPDGISMQRMMVAIQRANPEAFIRGNMNLIKAGAVLRIPSDAASVSQAEALGEVATQAQDWRGDRSVEAAYEPVPAAEPASAPASPAQGGYLKLTGDEATAGASAAGGTGEGTGGAPATLSEAQEALAAKEREIADLQARVQSLEEQKETYEKLVEVESESLAAAEQAAATPASEPAAAADAKPSAQPPAVQPPAPEPGLLERLLGNTMVLAGVLGVIFIAVLAFLFKRQRSIATYQPMPEPTQRGAALKQKKRSEEAREEPLIRAPEPVSTTTFAPPVAAVAAAVSAPAPAPAAAEPEPSDPISEAEIYIAYGRQERAIEVLERALAADATQTDVRLKLMELHAEREEETAFIAHYDWLQAAGDAGALRNARDLLSRSGSAQWVHEVDAPRGVQTGASDLAPPSAAELPEETELARFDVEDGGLATDLEFDLDTAFDKPADTAAEEPDEFDLELGELELGSGDAALDLGLTGAPESRGAEAEPATELPELEPEASQAAERGTEAEEDLDLLEGADEIETKLELARAYIDMGDVDGARDILDEVMSEGSAAQREQASGLLERLRAP